VQAALNKAHELGILYADEDWAPISDLTLALLLKRAGIRWEYAALDGLCEIIAPPICGIHIMLVERAQTPGEKRFAVRHGLAHVLAGHVEEASFVRDRDPLSHEERVADMFAFADLLPDRMLEEMRAAGYGFFDLSCWVIAQMRLYCPSWRLTRLHDRLKMLLPLPPARANDSTA
jgi:hypothetical protein